MQQLSSLSCYQHDRLFVCRNVGCAWLFLGNSAAGISVSAALTVLSLPHCYCDAVLCTLLVPSQKKAQALVPWQQKLAGTLFFFPTKKLAIIWYQAIKPFSWRCAEQSVQIGGPDQSRERWCSSETGWQKIYIAITAAERLWYWRNGGGKQIYKNMNLN